MPRAQWGGSWARHPGLRYCVFGFQARGGSSLLACVFFRWATLAGLSYPTSSRANVTVRESTNIQAARHLWIQSHARAAFA